MNKQKYLQYVYLATSPCDVSSGLQTSAEPVKIDGVVLQPEVTGGYAHICSL